MTTPEKRALQVAGQELAAFADELPNPAWLAYADGYIFWFNRAWREYTGSTTEETQGWGWSSVHHPDELASITETWTRAIAAGTAVELTIPLKGRDGTYRPFLTRAVPIRDSFGTVIRWFGTKVDVSAQVAAEQEARRAQVSLLRVSRLSAMGAMASTLAHELNQPLGAAANYIAAANEHLKRSPVIEKQRLQHYLASASESCLKAGRIIHSMREFAATGKVTTDAEDLKEMISATIVDFLGSEAPEGLEFDFTCPDGLAPVMCDRIQIEQVLVNLYSNSVRAMATVEARLIRIDVTARPDVVLIRLGDNGPGFIGRSPEELFEPFWSTTDVGLGLGLPLCRTIIEAHGGAIWGERGNRDGACFVIRLPVPKRRSRGRREVSPGLIGGPGSATGNAVQH